MDHSLLPSIKSASLPAKYQAAKVALAECNRIDECKDWADKTMALASYAKQSGDKEMENTAMRIRARAIRRCGELLQEFEKGTGAHLKSGGAPTFMRKDAAKEAGMSKDQAVTAIRVANVNGESFEQQIESDNPPTITNLAEQGKSSRVPHYVQRITKASLLVSLAEWAVLREGAQPPRSWVEQAERDDPHYRPPHPS
jgi:hypothetical protein